MARSLLFGFLACLVFGLVSLGLLGSPPLGDVSPILPRRVVFLGGEMSAEALIQFTSAAAARDDNSVLLFDIPDSQVYTKAFLKAYHPDRVVPVGIFPQGINDLERRLELRTESAVSCAGDPPLDMWKRVLGKSESLVICPDQPRSLVLQTAALAAQMKAPLYLSHGRPDEPDRIEKLVQNWRPKDAWAIGETAKLCRNLKNLDVHTLAKESHVASLALKLAARMGPLETIVVANPADFREGLGNMATLAPWVAVRHRAALVLTNPTGDDVEVKVSQALENRLLHRAESLILVASLKGVPMKQRPNPIPADKDPAIEMEPFTPTGFQPATFATGRLFHEQPAILPLILARQQLWTDKDQRPRKALVASNPGGSLPLLEAFSRNTIKELHNAGFEITSLIGNQVNKDDLRRMLGENDLFLWEGHHNTLIRDYAFPEWDEPLPPSLVFLQSCLALKEEKVLPLLQHGAIGVVGSSTRVYSASGGACSLAFMDALLYDNQSLGGALRQAKNFLLAYALLKEKRLGDQARRSGANLRSAWAFTLWGDPTLKLPHPELREDSLAGLGHEVQGNTIVLKAPPLQHDRVYTSKYQVQMPPNGRLAGLIHRDGDEDGLPLVPMFFAEIALPKAPAGKTPHLQSRIPSNRYVFTWDERRKTGYLLVLPRLADHNELRFYVHWSAQVQSAG
ncbi:MAG: C25 family cysteine peptidase [Gemmataceae bacterium]